MPAHHLAVGAAYLGLGGQIFSLIRHIPRQAHDIFGHATGGLDHIADIVQRLFHLTDEIMCLEFLICCPADLATDKQMPVRAKHPIGIALGRCPSFGLDHLMRHLFSFSVRRLDAKILIGHGGI
jgi:hypothetical protein